MELVKIEEAEKQIIFHHGQAENYRKETLKNAQEAVRHVVQAGRLLNQIKEEKKGEFDLWIESFSKSRISTDTNSLSRATIYRYIKAAKYYDSKIKSEIENGSSMNFQQLQTLYIEAGIMPPKESKDPQPKGEQPVFEFKFRFEPIEKWNRLEKEEFIARAKPVVDLYNQLIS